MNFFEEINFKVIFLLDKKEYSVSEYLLNSLKFISSLGIMDLNSLIKYISEKIGVYNPEFFLNDNYKTTLLYFFLKKEFGEIQKNIFENSVRVYEGLKAKNLNTLIPNLEFTGIESETNPRLLKLNWPLVIKNHLRGRIDFDNDYLKVNFYFYFSEVTDLELRNLNTIEKDKKFFTVAFENSIKNKFTSSYINDSIINLLGADKDLLSKKMEEIEFLNKLGFKQPKEETEFNVEKTIENPIF